MSQLHFHSEPELFGEQSVFAELKKLSGDWHVFYSLGFVDRRGFDRQREIDFVALHPFIGLVFIEVKGRIEGASDFQITRREVLTAKNLEDNYRLALVRVSQNGPDHDEIRYIARQFDLVGTEDFSITRFTVDWNSRWKEGGAPK